MQAIRVKQKLQSDTLVLPQLRPWVGQDVEIIVLTPDAPPAPLADRVGASKPLTGSILRDEDPFGPAVPLEEWEANR
jgi:hypothetical protein